MRRRNGRVFLSLCLLASLLPQAVAVRAMQAPGAFAAVQEAGAQDSAEVYKALLREAHGAEYRALLERIFGGEAGAAADVFDEGSAELIRTVAEGAGQKAEASLQRQIEERRARPSATPVVEPKAKPARRPAAKPRKAASAELPKLDWRRLAFGFTPLSREEAKPEVKMTETDKEVRAEGEDRKSFETKDAKGSRTQKVETRYIKDGKTFGVEIKNTQVVEAVSKADGKSFRQEMALTWGAQVAACPDADGVSAGTGLVKAVVKTSYADGGAPYVMTQDFDIRAKLAGHVNDQAELTGYDMQFDAYLDSSGSEEAVRRNLTKEVKLRDGRYGFHLDIPGNTLERSDGTYGGKRTPAKLGKLTGRVLAEMSEAEGKEVGTSLGKMWPSIWVSANQVYESAESNWKNGGCVEVVCKAAKLRLKPGEQIGITAETVHLQDGGKVNARLDAGAYPGQAAPESQAGRPSATFTLTPEGDETATFMVESVSKRGVGKGSVEFRIEREGEEGAVLWTGTITAERSKREEREKRSGANLAENGGYVETRTNVSLNLTGRLDRTVEATNAHAARALGSLKRVDYEYDRYKVDEGYCGPEAVPYKGPKEVTRTSTTVADISKETRVFIEIGGTEGGLTFSLPELSGQTEHAYVHKSPCAEHDRANTNEASDEDVPVSGGSFSVSFPVDPAAKVIKGSLTVRDQDGGTTTYTWELTRL